jgi:hypothetical protein
MRKTKWVDLDPELRDELRAGRERNRLMRREEAAWRREERRKLPPRRLKRLSRVPIATKNRLRAIGRLWHALRTVQGFYPQRVTLKATLVRVIDGEYGRLRAALEGEADRHPEYADAIEQLLADAVYPDNTTTCLLPSATKHSGE